MGKLGITVLGSGSRGNSIVLHSGSEAIMIDAGFSRKEILTRLQVCGIVPQHIRGILVSHEHGDHVKGLRLFSEDFTIPNYGTTRTMELLYNEKKTGSKLLIFESGTYFNIGNFNIRPFSVPHDAIDPVGFVVEFFDYKVGIATDLGHVNSLCVRHLHDCDALILESNHDVEMQRNSERHARLKQRVLGKHGHLSNDDALNSLPSLLSSRTKFLCLAHLSSECNSSDLLRSLAQKRLAEMQKNDILLEIAAQSIPSKTVWLGNN